MNAMQMSEADKVGNCSWFLWFLLHGKDITCVVRSSASTNLEARAELNHFLGLHVLETVDTGDTITNGQNTASFLELRLAGLVEDALLKDAGNLSGGYKTKNKNKKRV